MVTIVVCALSAAAAATVERWQQYTVERWQQYEIDLSGPSTGNPFVDVSLSATFTLEHDRHLTVRGFYDGGSSYKVRFAPPTQGEWTWVTTSNVAALNSRSGTVVATAPSAGNHGPVVSDGHELRYADGTPYVSVGSTAYQWASMPLAMQAQTLRTLKEGQGDGAVFNKLRMTTFPKWYRNNHQNPVEVGVPYDILPGSRASDPDAWGCIGESCPSLSGSFDLIRFNVSWWRNYERLIDTMQALHVIADIIVFHPYDNGHWGFDCMGGREVNATHPYDTTHDALYLEYLTARLSSYSNVWWAMANEWNFCACKSFNATSDTSPTPTWDSLFRSLVANDPYRRETSIHNGALLYNHSQPWINHVSLQSHEFDTPTLRAKYGKPVVWDEERYEGNISSSWGALSGPEMVDRFWWGASLGVHVGHSETIERPNVADDAQPLWWAKGGSLVGTSPPRIRWFGSLWAGGGVGAPRDAAGARPPFGSLVPSQSYLGDTSQSAFAANLLSARDGSYVFVHFLRPGRWVVPLAHARAHGANRRVNGTWHVRFLDYWGMRVSAVATLPANASSAVIDAPAVPANYELVFVK